MSNSGWNRSSSTRPPAQKKPSALRGVVAGLVVVILALAGAWYFLGDSLTSTEPKKTSRKTVKQQKTASTNKPTVSEQKGTAPVAIDNSAKNRRDALRRAETETPEETNNANVEPKKEKKKPVITNGTDQLIAMAMSTPSGVSMPPLPNIGEGENKQFLKTLKQPIKIEPGDSESVKAIKTMLQNTREEIVNLMEENPAMSFGDILQEHRKIHNENVDTRAQVAQELQKIIDEGDVEGAKKFRMTMNLALQQMGIEEVDIPITDEEKEAAAQNEEAESE